LSDKTSNLREAAAQQEEQHNSSQLGEEGNSNSHKDSKEEG
jgi:hypothetical protein